MTNINLKHSHGIQTRYAIVLLSYMYIDLSLTLESLDLNSLLIYYVGTFKTPILRITLTSTFPSQAKYMELDSGVCTHLSEKNINIL